MTPVQAILWASFWEFAAFLLIRLVLNQQFAVGNTMANFAEQSVIDPYLILSALVGAAIWVAVCTKSGMPISTSHALIGGIIGAAWFVNGSAVLGPDGGVLYERFMEPEHVSRVYETLCRFDVQINSYVPNGLFCLNTRVLKRPSTLLTAYTGEGRMVLDDRATFEREGLNRVYKLEGLTEDAATMAKLRAALAETGALVTHSSPRNVELMSPGMGKAAALKWLANRLGVALCDCMAFGDNANDLDMLGAVGWPVAVGNATDEVKRIARIVADTDANDGVAKVILETLNRS
jgi:HAD superfamily hydrolase (TIGR01484 family)